MVIASSLTGVVPVVPLPNYTWGLLSTYTSWDDPPSFPGFSSFISSINHPHPPPHAIGLGSNTQCSCVSKHRWSEYRPGLEKGEGFGVLDLEDTPIVGCASNLLDLFLLSFPHTHTRYKIRKVNTAGTCCKYMPLERKGNDRSSNQTKPPGKDLFQPLMIQGCSLDGYYIYLLCKATFFSNLQVGGEAIFGAGYMRTAVRRVCMSSTFTLWTLRNGKISKFGMFFFLRGSKTITLQVVQSDLLIP